MLTIGQKIKSLRTQLNFTQEDLAQAANTTKQTIHKYETGIISNIPASKIKAIADKLDTTPAYLMGWDKQNEPDITDDVVTFDIIGEVAAGYDSYAFSDWENGQIDIPKKYLHGRPESDFFVLRVTGDSMYPLYLDGDIVLVLKQTYMERSGQIGIVLYDNEYGTLKKVEYVNGENWVKLVTINPIYPPITIKDSDLEQFKILGVPKLLIRSIND